MATFRSLAELQKYLENNVAETLARSMDVERVLSDEMSQAVVDVVYAAYSPTVYDRRMDEGGLSDTRNMEIVDWGVRDGKAFLVFENLTQGNDGQSSVYISDMIEQGIKNMWSNPDGAWSEPRGFVAETQRRLKENPHELIEAIKNGLRQKGMRIR